MTSGRNGDTGVHPFVGRMLEAFRLCHRVALAHELSIEVPSLDDRPGASGAGRLEIATRTIDGHQPSTTLFSDRVSFHTHTGTHIDAFGHWARDGYHFGGAPAQTRPEGRGMVHYGAETIPPILARGVLIDLVRWNKGAPLEGGYQITSQAIRDSLHHNPLELLPDDVVLIRTGWSRHWSDPTRYMSEAPGLTRDAAAYLCDMGCRAIGIDQWSVDVMPPEGPSDAFACHALCLVERGVYLIENLELERLGALNASQFVLVLAVVPMSGATGFPVQPIALVPEEARPTHEEDRA